MEAAAEREAGAPLTREASGARFVLLVIAQVFLAFVAPWAGSARSLRLRRLRTAPPGRPCDYALRGRADTVMTLVIAAAFTATISLVLIRVATAR